MIDKFTSIKTESDQPGISRLVGFAEILPGRFSSSLLRFHYHEGFVGYGLNDERLGHRTRIGCDLEAVFSRGQLGNVELLVDAFIEGDCFCVKRFPCFIKKNDLAL